MPKQPRDELVRRGDVGADSHAPGAQDAGIEGNLAARRRCRDAEGGGQRRVKAPVELTKEILGKRGSRVARRPALAFKVRQRELLQVALLRLLRKFILEGGFDVRDECLLALDEVGIVAVHEAGDLGHFLVEGSPDACLQLARSLDHEAGQILKGSALLLGKGRFNRGFVEGHILPIFLPIRLSNCAIVNQYVTTRYASGFITELPIFLPIIVSITGRWGE